MTWANFSLLLFGLSWAFTGIYRRFALNKGYVDSPNVRSSHVMVTPRGGGIVFVSLWYALIGYATYYFWIPNIHLYLFLPAALVAIVGFIDDMKDTSAKTRLIVQSIAAILCLFVISLPSAKVMNFELPMLDYFNGISLQTLLISAIAFVGILWMTNLMNFMDGTDGLCATQAVVVLGFASVVFYQVGGYSFSILCVGACALILGFLTWNWPAANIFMGDVGSAFLGFMIAIMSLAGYKWFHVPLGIWLILTCPFWFDATATLLRRIANGDKWTEAHCLHAYQRLTHVGWSHLQVLMAFIAIYAVMVWMAWIGYKQPNKLHLLMGLSTTFVGVLYLMVEIYKPMYRSWHHAQSR